MHAQSELERYRNDALHFEAHQGELLKQYPEQWVAIFNQQVVGADADFERLLDRLQAKGLPVGRVFVEHVTTRDELLILTL